VTTLTKRVHQPRHQRNLRADDSQVDTLTLDGSNEPGDIVHSNVEQPRVGRNPRVARRAQQLRCLRRPREGAHKRMLTPPRSDNEYAQGQSEAISSSTGMAASVS
jgi:hypothetical protein